MLCFSMLTIWKWCWSPASFLAPSGSSTFPVVAICLRNPSLWKILRPHIGVVLMFLRYKSSRLLSKTFAVVDAIPWLICSPFLKSVIKNFRTFLSTTGPTINGLPRVKLVVHSAGGWFKVFSILLRFSLSYYSLHFFKNFLSFNSRMVEYLLWKHFTAWSGPWSLAYFAIL